MKGLFKKSELGFAIMLIVVYVVGSSLMQRVSAMIGIQFVGEVVFNIVLSAVILVFCKKNRLFRHLGLCKAEVSAKKALFYIPMLFMGVQFVFLGAGITITPVELALRTVMMICVGFLEEVTFRGFLFRGIAKDSLKQAIIISSVTFGIGHIVNLLNGYDIMENAVQVVLAVALGFMLVFVRVRTGSLIPCIVFHGVFNSMSAVANHEVLINAVGNALIAEIIIAAVYLAVSLLYTVYLVKRLPERKLAD